MIEVTKLNDTFIIINADLIETIEATPDSVITLLNGKKFVVKENVDEIMAKAIKYKQRVTQVVVAD